MIAQGFVFLPEDTFAQARILDQAQHVLDAGNRVEQFQKTLVFRHELLVLERLIHRLENDLGPSSLWLAHATMRIDSESSSWLSIKPHQSRYHQAFKPFRPRCRGSHNEAFR